MSVLDVQCFHYEPCAAAYARIATMAKKRGMLLSFSDLVEDPALSEDFRDILRDSKRTYAKTMESAKSLVDILEKYRKTRALYHMAKDIHLALKGTEVDIDKMLDEASEKLAKARSGDSLTQLVRIIGKDANALNMVNEALDLTDDIMLKTGFDEFDTRNGGLPAEGVHIVAATTSGGKSVMGMNLAKNMYKINKVSVATCSLEMNDKKQTRRFLSSETGIELAKFNHKTLTAEERKQCRIAWKKFHRYGEENDCRYAIMSPSHAVNAQQVLMTLKPFGFKVIVIDYVGLLETNDKDQWKALGEVVRQCKIFSMANHCLIVVLAQLDSEDDHIRYSKGMLEHADNCIAGDSWVDTPDGFMKLANLNPKSNSKFKVVSEGKARLARSLTYKGILPTKTVTTYNGYEVAGTLDHRIKVLKPTLEVAWVPLNDIRAGDYVAVDKRSVWTAENAVVPLPNLEFVFSEQKGRVYDHFVPTSVPKTCTPELARLIGHLLAEGTISGGRKQIGFVTAYEEVMNDYLHCFESVFGFRPGVCRSKTNYLTSVVERKWISEFFKNIPGMTGGSRKKFIPDFILQSSKEVVANCLLGMFEGDGGKGHDRVMYYTTSKEMGVQVQLLLLKFGIVSRRIRVPIHNSEYHKKHSPKAIRYDIQVAGHENLQIFNDQIGFISDRKRLGVKDVLFTKGEPIPYFGAILRDRHAGTRDGLLRASGLFGRVEGSHSISSSVLKSPEFLSKLKDTDPEMFKVAKALNKEDCLWVRVEKNRSSGLKPVYDITVPSTESFVANGIVVHNCWIWNYSKQEQRDLHIIPVRQLKARDQELFPFDLQEKFETMQLISINTGSDNKSSSTDGLDQPPEVEYQSGSE